MPRLEGKEYVVQDGDVVEFRFEGNEVLVSKLGSAVVWLKPGVEWDFLEEACRALLISCKSATNRRLKSVGSGNDPRIRSLLDFWNVAQASRLRWKSFDVRRDA